MKKLSIAEPKFEISYAYKHETNMYLIEIFIFGSLVSKCYRKGAFAPAACERFLIFLSNKGIISNAKVIFISSKQLCNDYNSNITAFVDK